MQSKGSTIEKLRITFKNDGIRNVLCETGKIEDYIAIAIENNKLEHFVKFRALEMQRKSSLCRHSLFKFVKFIHSKLSRRNRCCSHLFL